MIGLAIKKEQKGRKEVIAKLQGLGRKHGNQAVPGLAPHPFLQAGTAWLQSFTLLLDKNLLYRYALTLKKGVLLCATTFLLTAMK
jgi:hypothetical protein